MPEDKDLEHRCIYQLCQPVDRTSLGWGNCKECKFDLNNNKKCRGYFPYGKPEDYLRYDKK